MKQGENEVVQDHQHHCPRCRESYGGFNPRCLEEKVLLCGRCVGAQFAPVQRRAA